MKNLFGILLLSVILSGCAGPKYTANPIKEEIKAEVVIVNDKETRDGFQNRVESWVDQHNYEYIAVPEGTKYDLDKVTLEYVGVWRWDLALFLEQASINAYYKGQRIGDVNYRAPNNLNGNKFGNADERIGYMMDILFGQMSVSEGNSLINPSTKK